MKTSAKILKWKQKKKRKSVWKLIKNFVKNKETCATSNCNQLYHEGPIFLRAYQPRDSIRGSCARTHRHTVQDFYQSVYTWLSLILNKLSSLDMSNTALNILTKTFRGKAFNMFIRGLNGDMPRLLATRDAKDLPLALSPCQKLDNQIFKTNYANNVNANSWKYNKIPPQLPTDAISSNIK